MIEADVDMICLNKKKWIAAAFSLNSTGNQQLPSPICFIKSTMLNSKLKQIDCLYIKQKALSITTTPVSMQTRRDLKLS